MSKLQQVIEAAGAEGRVARIPFLPGGYPDKERFWEEIAKLDGGGADVIEIGVPFSDPVADGSTVEEASLVCLEAGVNLAWILEELGRRRGSIKAQIVLMGYLNPFFQHGFKAFAKDAAAAGVAGIIVPDLPLDESGDFKAALAEQGIDLVYLVGLNTAPERLKAYAAEAGGFVYVVSVLGITGARASLPEEAIRAKLAEVKAAFSVPVALGFGISKPEQLLPFAGVVDAAVFGSALINHIKDGGDGASFMAVWSA